MLVGTIFMMLKNNEFSFKISGKKLKHIFDESCVRIFCEFVKRWKWLKVIPRKQTFLRTC